MKSNNSKAVRVAVFFFVIFMVSLSAYLWWRDGVAPVNRADTSPITFSIMKGENVRTITTKLAKDGLIRSPVAFFILVKLKAYDRTIQAGEFRLTRSMDAQTIATELTHGVFDTWVTVLEGWRKEEIASKVSKELSIPETEFLKVAKEGYMFPDTYAVQKDATAGAVIAMFLHNFETKVDATLIRDSAKQGLTLDNTIILASIVEREGKSETDRPVIAGILLNRLRNGIPLQVDATIQYAIGYSPDEKTWWKKTLTNEDKEIKSPYNTYIHAGLPPGPISNPGLSAIRAVIYPTATSYYFYLHDTTGVVHYATTLEEHEKNIATYLK